MIIEEKGETSFDVPFKKIIKNYLGAESCLLVELALYEITELLSCDLTLAADTCKKKE